jgi:hypothetical protein
MATRHGGELIGGTLERGGLTGGWSPQGHRRAAGTSCCLAAEEVEGTGFEVGRHRGT